MKENQINIIKGQSRKPSVIIEKGLVEELKKYDQARNECTIGYILGNLSEFNHDELIQIQKSYRNAELSKDEKEQSIILYCVGYNSEKEADIVISKNDNGLSQDVVIEYRNNQNSKEFTCTNYLHYFVVVSDQVKKQMRYTNQAIESI